MAIITFWNDNTGKIGQSYSALAIATYIGIEHNYKTLLVSTKCDDEVTLKAFGANERQEAIKMLTENKMQSMELESGIESLSKLVTSNRLTPEIVSNYTKVILKDRLEIITAPKKEAGIEYDKLYDSCVDILAIAKKHYDIIFVDLNNGITKDTTKEILKKSDVVVLNMEQKSSEIQKISSLKSNKELFDPNRAVILINNYDRKSKYSAKNIGRELGKKNGILTIPYNNLFSDAIQERAITEFFLNLRTKKFDNMEDRTAFFINELKKTSEAILYKMQELQMMM